MKPYKKILILCLTMFCIESKALADELDKLSHSLKAIAQSQIYPIGYATWNLTQQIFWGGLLEPQKNFWASLNTQQKELFKQCHISGGKGFGRRKGGGGGGKFGMWRGMGGFRGGKGGGMGPMISVSIPGIQRPDGTMGAGWHWKFSNGPNIKFWNSLNQTQQNLLAALTQAEQEVLQGAYGKASLLQ